MHLPETISAANIKGKLRNQKNKKRLQNLEPILIEKDNFWFLINFVM